MTNPAFDKLPKARYRKPPIWCAIACSLIISSCSSHQPGPEILFIVPNNFLGTIELTENKAKGIAPTPVFKGYRFEIPPSGKLVIKDLSIFESWHQLRILNESGNDVPYRDGGSGAIVDSDMREGPQTFRWIIE